VGSAGGWGAEGGGTQGGEGQTFVVHPLNTSWETRQGCEHLVGDPPLRSLGHKLFLKGGLCIFPTSDGGFQKFRGKRDFDKLTKA